MDQVKKSIQEFLDDFMSNEKNAEWARQCRIAYLRDRLEHLIIAYAPEDIVTEDWLLDLIREQQARIKKEIDMITAEILAWKKPQFKDKKITPAMIEQAKEFPIGQLIEINKRGFAKCVWHNDINPSMYCKNNYAYCFSCGSKGDAIDIYMALYACNFKEAVVFLSK